MPCSTVWLRSTSRCFPASAIASLLMAGRGRGLVGDLLGDTRRRLGQMREAVPIGAEPHGQRTQLDDQVVQLGLRHQRLDLVPAGPARTLGIAEDLAAP